jgi:hypothetical protein
MLVLILLIVSSPSIAQATESSSVEGSDKPKRPENATGLFNVTFEIEVIPVQVDEGIPKVNLTVPSRDIPPYRVEPNLTPGRLNITIGLVTDEAKADGNITFPPGFNETLVEERLRQAVERDIERLSEEIDPRELILRSYPADWEELPPEEKWAFVLREMESKRPGENEVERREIPEADLEYFRELERATGWKNLQFSFLIDGEAILASTHIYNYSAGYIELKEGRVGEPDLGVFVDAVWAHDQMYESIVKDRSPFEDGVAVGKGILTGKVKIKPFSSIFTLLKVAVTNPEAAGQLRYFLEGMTEVLGKPVG